MASVKRQPGSPFWYACYRDRYGTRRQRSTGTKDKNEASRIAHGMESLGRNWSRERAEAMVIEIADAHGEQMRDKTRIQVFFRQWIDARASSWSDSTYKTFYAVHKQFTDLYGYEDLSGITKRDISEYRDKLTGMGRSASSVRGHIKYLRRVFATAIEQGRLQENPAAVALPKPTASQKQPFTLAQFKALLNATDGEWRDFVLLAGLTGQRRVDCLNLRHEDIDRENGLITFWPRKTARTKGKPHVEPLHHLIAESIPTGFGYVLPTLQRLPLEGSRSVSDVFRREVLPLIGIDQPYGKSENGCRTATKYSLHSLRHMLSTELERMGASPETRMAIVGHDDKKVSAGYTHADFAVASEMLAKVGV